MSRGIMQFTDRSEWEKQRKDRQRGKVLVTAVPFGPGSRQGDAANEQESPGNGLPGETAPEQLMAVLLRQDRLTAVQTFSSGRKSRIGAIYLGKVKKAVKNLNACFVEIADREQCFLPLDTVTDPPFLTNRAYDGRILEGDELLVQVEHDAIKTKQAAVTTRISLQGEYFVLSTGEMRAGISKKLGDKQRKEIRRLLTEWQVTTPNGVPVQQEGIPPFGLVVRTQAGLLLRQASEENQEETEGTTAGAAEFLHREYEELYRRFTALFLQGRHRTCFTCLQEAGSALEEALKTFQTGEYEEVVTDLAGIYDELKQLQGQKVFLADKVLRLYQDECFSLRQLYGLSAKLEEALGRTVWMKSGANLVIEQTESLTAIDVNTGKSTAGLSGKSSAETIRRVNLEAAREVARQLRLRNLSGIIIVDFINMASADQKEELMAYLRELVREDPVTVRVVDMTPLGLVEITRKKVSPSLLEQFGRRRAAKEL